MLGQKVTDGLTVSAQIGPGAIGAIAAAGFRSIICNRPDGEEPGQPAFETIETEAKAKGLDIRHQPVTSGSLSQDDVDAFAALTEALPAPTFAYCRSGTRCILLWAHAECKRQPLDDVLELARKAGFNLSKV